MLFFTETELDREAIPFRLQYAKEDGGISECGAFWRND